MANPSIGSVDVLTMEGIEPFSPLLRAVDVTRAGVHGVALHQIGKRSAPYNVRTEADVDTLSTWIASAKSLVGTIVTVTAPDNRSIQHVYVHDVKIIWGQTKKVLNPVGGLTAGQWFVAAHWVLQNVSAS